MGSLAGQVAVVTGASRGIGRGIALALADEGAIVYATGRTVEAGKLGWLAHESCSISGEMLICVAGRVAKALIAETPGVYRPSWSIEDVARQIDAIRAPHDLWTLSALPAGFFTHLERSFAMATNAEASGARSAAFTSAAGS
jgi:hypothetical protein